jgi:hypothetical protein
MLSESSTPPRRVANVPAERVCYVNSFRQSRDFDEVTHEIAPMASSLKSAKVPAAGPTMGEVFGPGGLLEKYMPAGCEHRPSQLEMVELIDEVFRTRPSR